MWILAGLIVGVVAKWLVPGEQPGGPIATISLGVAGAFAGGMVSSAIGIGGLSGPNIPNLARAIGDALHSAWSGERHYEYAKDEDTLRVRWVRDSV